MSIIRFSGVYNYMEDQEGTIEDVPEIIYDTIAAFDDLYEDEGGVYAIVYKHPLSKVFSVSFYAGGDTLDESFDDKYYKGSIDFQYPLVRYG